MTNPLQEIAGRWALITGASTGIGKVFAVELAKKGAQLIVCARDATRLTALAEDLRAISGGEVRVVACDLETAEGVGTLLREVQSWSLELELLINNAGFGAAGRFARAEFATLERMTRLNCTSLAELTHAFLPGMLARGRGGIIQVASIAGFVPTPYMALYGATKAYVLSLTVALAEEVRGSGVRVVALCPGPVPTGFQNRAGYQKIDANKAGAMSAESVVAQALNAYAKGQTICVPGRLNAWQVRLTRLLPLGLATRAAALILRRSGRDV